MKDKNIKAHIAAGYILSTLQNLILETLLLVALLYTISTVILTLPLIKGYVLARYAKKNATSRLK